MKLTFVNELPERKPMIYRSKWAEIVEKLKKRPGEWALFKNQWSSTGANIRRKFGPENIEVSYRNCKDNKGDMYIRWVEKK